MKRFRLAVAAALVTVPCWAGGALAEPGAATDDLVGGTDLSAIERVIGSRARGEAPLSLATSGGYGYTGSVLGLGDRHHRFTMRLVAEGAPLPWLGVGLQLDGRYDRHAFASLPSDQGWTGEPRFYVRADRRVGDRLSLGARALVWLPPGDAPSLVAEAATADLLGLCTWSRGALELSGNLGYRVDHSELSAPNAMEFGEGDRLALGVSGFDAALLGIGARYRGRGRQLYGQWSWDLLVGHGAPSPLKSPMRLAVGLRQRIKNNLALEVLGELSPSARPETPTSTPMVPVPARLAVMAGLVMGLGAAPPPPPAPAPRVQIVRVREPTPTFTRLEVRLAYEGGAPLLPVQVRVVLRRGDTDEPLAPEAGGAFVLAEAKPGDAVIVANAEGYELATVALALRAGPPSIVEVPIKRPVLKGKIRGFVSSFNGKPVTATVSIAAVRGAAAGRAAPTEALQVQTQDGRFQLDVPVGEYRVTIVAHGYVAQERVVRVEVNGITVLNADLRGAW